MDAESISKGLLVQGVEEPQKQVVVKLWKKLVAEFVGTFILCIFGLGTIASNVYLGQEQIVPFAFSLGLFIGLQVLGHVSGGHFNPAITFAFAIVRPDDMAWIDVPSYILAQVGGAMTAAGTLIILLWGVINVYENGPPSHSRADSVSVWALKWTEGMLWGDAFFLELLMTSSLAFVVFAITNKKKVPASTRAMAPFVVPLTVMANIFMGGPFTGTGINPARDFGPRLAAALSCHWSSEDVFNDTWVYLIAPMIGAPLGAWIAEKIPSQPNTEWYSSYEVAKDSKV